MPAETGTYTLETGPGPGLPTNPSTSVCGVTGETASPSFPSHPSLWAGHLWFWVWDKTQESAPRLCTMRGRGWGESVEGPFSAFSGPIRLKAGRGLELEKDPEPVFSPAAPLRGDPLSICVE